MEGIDELFQASFSRVTRIGHRSRAGAEAPARLGDVVVQKRKLDLEASLRAARSYRGAKGVRSFGTVGSERKTRPRAHIDEESVFARMNHSDTGR